LKPGRLPFRGFLDRTPAAYVVLLGTLLLTLLAWYYVDQNVENRERARFEETVTVTKEAVDQRMSAYVDAMLDGRGLFYAHSSSIERDEWRDYVAGSDVSSRYPGIQALGYVERVRPEEREDHVDRVREEGLDTYELRPSGERYEYFPVVYLEPSEASDSGMLGYDVYSHRVNRAAMEQARDTGLPRASGKVYLTEAGLTQEVFLIYTPVYREGETPETLPERRQDLQGFIVGVFRADELLEGIFGGKIDPSINFEVFDGAEYTPERLLHDDDDSLYAGDPSYRPSFSDVTTLEVAGRYWSLYFSTIPGSEGDWLSNLPLVVLLSGLAMSFLLFGITWMLSHNRLLAERASRELEDANHELEATNRELEAFSYSVSHDLRAPLRSIDGFSQILLEDYSEELDEEGKDYLSRVRAASQRMGRLIDDLLGLSRVTRSALRWVPVDLSAQAREIIADLCKRESERRVEVEVSDGLVAYGDARLLRVVLENLIGNAWKFTEKESEARIEFGVTRFTGAPVYYVSDNGAGFEMAYADKLFGAFQRLHGSEEFEGTGIGLATVQRVVHRHGGRIWAEGEVGRGATFFFTLGPGGQA
jgi:signal transduction histidine kinase